jgi:hypothetical protein
MDSFLVGNLKRRYISNARRRRVGDIKTNLKKQMKYVDVNGFDWPSIGSSDGLYQYGKVLSGSLNDYWLPGKVSAL